MKLQRLNGTLLVTDLGNLAGSVSRLPIGEIISRLTPDTETVEIDLAQTKIVDGYGLGALMSLYQEAHDVRRQPTIAIHLLNPAPPVRQLLELTRMRQFFEIKSAPNQSDKLDALLMREANSQGTDALAFRAAAPSTLSPVVPPGERVLIPGSASVSPASFQDGATCRRDDGVPRLTASAPISKAEPKL